MTASLTTPHMCTNIFNTILLISAVYHPSAEQPISPSYSLVCLALVIFPLRSNTSLFKPSYIQHIFKTNNPIGLAIRPVFFLNPLTLLQYCTFFKLSQHDIGVLKPNIRLLLRPLKYFQMFSGKSKISMFFCKSHQNYLKGPIFLFSSF